MRKFVFIAVYGNALVVGMASGAVLLRQHLVKSHGFLFNIFFNNDLSLGGFKANIRDFVARDTFARRGPNKGRVTGKTIGLNFTVAFADGAGADH